VDGVTVERFEHQAEAALPELLQQATEGTYRPLPLRLVVVEKPGGAPAAPGKKRDLLVPPVRDRILQTAVARMLSHSFEEEFLESNFAYRPGRGVDRAVARILQLRDRGWRFAVHADVESYFDSISHPRLIHMLENDEAIDDFSLGLLKCWIKGEIWDGHEVKPLRRGLAQGSPISPLLANAFLQPLDEALSRGDNKLIRYADDCAPRAQGAERAQCV
jgi:retron-type reverse transcriptase